MTNNSKSAVPDSVVPFAEALYELNCPTCDTHLEWEAAFDADGTSYSCECCNKGWWMSPHTVRVSCSDAEGGDEE